MSSSKPLIFIGNSYEFPMPRAPFVTSGGAA